MSEGLLVQLDPIPGITPPGVLPAAGFQFQCPPTDEFSVNYSFSFSDYTTIEKQRSRKGVSQLATITFDTLVVDWGTYTLTPDLVIIEEVTAGLRNLANSGAAFLLTAGHALPSGPFENLSEAMVGPEVQFPATLRNLTVTEKAGEGDARYLNVQFTEHRPAVQPRAGQGAGSNPIATTGRPAASVLPQTISLYWDGEARDAAGTSLATPVTLAGLAKHYYRDPSLGRALGQANDLGNWGANDPLIAHYRFSRLPSPKASKISIPARGSLPTAADPA